MRTPLLPRFVLFCSVVFLPTIPQLFSQTNAHAFSNSAWELRESGTTSSLYAVAYSDPGSGIAVGDSGAITTTADAGATWMPSSSGTTQRLNNVAVAGNVAVAVGENGTILRSTDAGLTWLNSSFVTPQHLRSVAFITGMIVLASGNAGTLLRSTDAGLSWNPVATAFTFPIISLSFVDENVGIALGAPIIGIQRLLRTLDGGESWSQINTSLFGSGLGQLTAGVLSPSGAGYVLGMSGQIILRTIDFGENWFVQSIDASVPLRGVAVVDAHTATIVGGGGTIIRTTNGGASWDFQDSDFAGTFNAVAFVNASTGAAVGANGAIYWTETGGILVSAPLNDLPGDARLFQNYPNPFNPSTTIQFLLSKGDYVDLKIYNSIGQVITTILAEERAVGLHSAIWNAAGYPSGVYYSRLIVDGRVLTGRLIFLR